MVHHILLCVHVGSLRQLAKEEDVDCSHPLAHLTFLLFVPLVSRLALIVHCKLNLELKVHIYRAGWVTA